MNTQSRTATLARWPTFKPAAAALERLSRLPRPAKAGIIIGGYLGAVLGAIGVVWIYVLGTGSPDRDQYSGMYAFGDLMLFVAVFGGLSFLPSALAFYLVRRSRRLWLTGSVAALLTAGTSIATILVAQVTLRAPATQGYLHFWGALEFPRVFLCPFLVILFGLGAWLAPELRSRRLLMIATGMEFLGVIYGFFRWFVPLMAMRMAA